MWTGCDVTCGIGTLTRRRTCSSPAPAFGGLNCTGQKEETQVCKREPCPGTGYTLLKDLMNTGIQNLKSRLIHSFTSKQAYHME